MECGEGLDLEVEVELDGVHAADDLELAVEDLEVEEEGAQEELEAADHEEGEDHVHAVFHARRGHRKLGVRDLLVGSGTSKK